MINKPIILLGMMGCGKSAIGQRLAERLGCLFVDSDAYVEAAEEMSITEIFNEKGENYFRDKEYEAIEEQMAFAPIVIAIGGGAFIQDKTRALIKHSAISVWIDAELDVLLERVMRNDKRPLLHTDDPEQTLKELIAKRLPIYEQADYKVTTTTGPHTLVIDQIMDIIER